MALAFLPGGTEVPSTMRTTRPARQMRSTGPCLQSPTLPKSYRVASATRSPLSALMRLAIAPVNRPEGDI